MLDMEWLPPSTMTHCALGLFTEAVVRSWAMSRQAGVGLQGAADNQDGYPNLGGQGNQVVTLGRAVLVQVGSGAEQLSDGEIDGHQVHGPVFGFHLVGPLDYAVELLGVRGLHVVGVGEAHRGDRHHRGDSGVVLGGGVVGHPHRAHAETQDADAAVTQLPQVVHPGPDVQPAAVQNVVGVAIVVAVGGPNVVVGHGVQGQAGVPLGAESLGHGGAGSGVEVAVGAVHDEHRVHGPRPGCFRR